MDRQQLEHVIRAAGDILGEDEIVILGSQAILGPVRHPPHSVLRSNEVDIAAFEDPLDEKATLINGTLGEGTVFNDSNGYYAEGVSLDLPRFPRNWRSRLTAVTSPMTNGVVGWCPDPSDLCISKLFARRPKDVAFTSDLIHAGIVDGEQLLDRLDETETTATERWLLLGSLKSAIRPGRKNPLRRRLQREIALAEQTLREARTLDAADPDSDRSSPGEVVVQAYRRRDGTIVDGHRRRRSP